jgi:hypothetical protein
VFSGKLPVKRAAEDLKWRVLWVLDGLRLARRPGLRGWRFFWRFLVKLLSVLQGMFEIEG